MQEEGSKKAKIINPVVATRMQESGSEEPKEATPSEEPSEENSEEPRERMERRENCT